MCRSACSQFHSDEFDERRFAITFSDIPSSSQVSSNHIVCDAFLLYSLLAGIVSELYFDTCLSLIRYVGMLILYALLVLLLPLAYPTLSHAVPFTTFRQSSNSIGRLLLQAFTFVYWRLMPFLQN